MKCPAIIAMLNVGETGRRLQTRINEHKNETVRITEEKQNFTRNNKKQLVYEYVSQAMLHRKLCDKLDRTKDPDQGEQYTTKERYDDTRSDLDQLSHQTSRTDTRGPTT